MSKTFIGGAVSDGNKNKMLRPRPGPVKQQQEHITEKNSSVVTQMFVIKI